MAGQGLNAVFFQKMQFFMKAFMPNLKALHPFQSLLIYNPSCARVVRCTVLTSFVFWFFRYYWKGEIQDASEVLMVNFLRKSLCDQRVLSRHVGIESRTVR